MRAQSRKPYPESQALFERGLAVRKRVLGDRYVEQVLEASDDFSWPLQEYLTVHAWGSSWSRGTLALKTRSMLNLAMLTALNRPAELRLHLRGALRTGVSKEEIAEIFLHAGVYCGAPAALDGFKIAREVFEEVESEDPLRASALEAKRT
jgi:4-carboxymuconolactone decarboxylase